ncbi:MAG: hypothetical protein RL459_2020 [Pseudomonadota bacterium]
MIGDDKAFFLGHIVLTFLDFSVKKFLDSPAIQANKVVMMLAFVELINRLAAFKMAALQNASLFELGEYTVNGCQPDI